MRPNLTAQVLGKFFDPLEFVTQVFRQQSVIHGVDVELNGPREFEHLPSLALYLNGVHCRKALSFW